MATKQELDNAIQGVLDAVNVEIDQINGVIEDLKAKLEAALAEVDFGPEVARLEEIKARIAGIIPDAPVEEPTA